MRRVLVHPVPNVNRNPALMNPSTDAADAPGGRCRRLEVGCRWPGEKLLTLSVSAPAERRWSHRPRRVWRRAVAWFQPPEEGRRPSASRNRGSMVRRVPPLAERRHRLRPKTPAPSARYPATWLTLDHTCPYICGSQHLILHPKLRFPPAHTTSWG